MDEKNRDPRQAGDTPPFPEQQQETPGTETALSPPADHGEHTYRGYGRLRDRVAIITGADSGIGRAVALAFAREGADIAAAYLNEHQDAEETKRLVEDAGRSALLLPGDIGEEAECARIVRDTVERFGQLDVLVNNAAFQGRAVEHFAQLDRSRVEHTFRTNILALFSLVRHALPHLEPGATIINTSSIQAYDPNPQILDYAVTKGAIRTFTQGLARELTARGIRVNAVAPGPIWTPLIPQSFPSEKVEQHGKRTPLGRPGQPAEVAPLFVFLASDESRYIVGKCWGSRGAYRSPESGRGVGAAWRRQP